MAAIDYIDPKGYWCDPSGNTRRMGDEDGEQEIVFTPTEACTKATTWSGLLDGEPSVSVCRATPA
jgi:hypothetical protein